MVKSGNNKRGKFSAALLVLLFSVFTPLAPIFSDNVSALTGADITKQTQAWQILSAIRHASGDNFKDNLTSSQFSSCDFIKEGDFVPVASEFPDPNQGQASYAIAVGYTASGGDGMWNAGSPPEGISNSFSQLGVADCAAFAKALGYSASGASYKSPGTNTIKDNAEKLGQALAKKIGATWGVAPNYMRYQALMSAFESSACQASYRVNYIPNDSIEGTGHNSEQVQQNLDAQKNGETSGMGRGHYYINSYRDNTVQLNTYYVGSDNFTTANIGYGLSMREAAGTMGCTTTQSNAGVIRQWLSQHKEFADDYKEKTKVDDPGAAPAPPASGQQGTNPGGSATSSCKIDGIGWIVCPIVRFLGSIADSSYGFVQGLLEVAPLQTDTSKNNGVYTAWSIMRNIANVAFVIAFVIIIYSQISGMGVSNYGIKKLLPKLIVAAILVNVSYWICAVAVDLSNIAGSTTKSLIDSITANMPTPPKGDPAANFWSGANGDSGIIATILVGGAGLYIGLSILLPVLITVIAAIMTALIVLILRQALIVILIFISPLAFVALLLPNTESLFKAWRKLFTTMLVMFPVIALVFGGSALASRVISISANSSDPTANTWFLQIVAAGVAVIPLFITPVVMKAAGGVLNRWAGVVNNPNKGMFDRMRKGAEGIRKDRQNVRNIRALNGKGFNQFGRGAAVRWNARRKAIVSGRENEMNRANTEYIADASEKSASFRNAAAGGTLLRDASTSASQRALANAINVQAKLEADEVNAASAVIKNLDPAALRALSQGGKHEGFDASTSHALRTAAMQKVINSQDIEGTNALLDQAASGGMADAKTRQSFAEVLANSSARPAYVGMGAIEEIKQGGSLNNATGKYDLNLKNSTELTVAALKNNTYSPDKLVSSSKDELEHVVKIAADPSIATDNSKIAAAANTALSEPDFEGKIGKQRDAIDNLSRL